MWLPWLPLNERDFYRKDLKERKIVFFFFWERRLMNEWKRECEE